MSSYSEIIRVWQDPNDTEKQLCVSAFPDSQEVIDLVINFNPSLTIADFVSELENLRVQNTGEWERPKQRPRN